MTASQPTTANTTEVKFTPNEPSQFENFEDLARRLVQVPKHEVDALRKQHEAEKG